MRRFNIMRKEYDFSKAERGKFYRKGGQLRLPIYLEVKLQNRLQRIAQRHHEQLGDTVQRLLKKEVSIVS